MTYLIQLLLNTSEVWALLIPLIFISFKKIDNPALKEIIFYLRIAFILNLIIVVISFLPDYYDTTKLPFLLQNNTIEYNMHSVIRVVLFTLYFMRNNDDALHLQRKIILGFFFAFVLFNFIVLESPVRLFSSRLFTVEAIVLLFFYIYYFLNAIIREKNEKLTRQPIFWIASGLGIYEAVNFFIFLLFTYLVNNYTIFAVNIWNLHNITFIILCIFITKALYESSRK